MSDREKLSETMDRLTVLSREKRHLTYDELNDALSEDIVSPTDIDNIFIKLDSMDINLIESATIS